MSPPHEDASAFRQDLNEALRSNEKFIGAHVGAQEGCGHVDGVERNGNASTVLSCSMHVRGAVIKQCEGVIGMRNGMMLTAEVHGAASGNISEVVASAA